MVYRQALCLMADSVVMPMPSAVLPLPLPPKIKRCLPTMVSGWTVAERKE